MAESSRIHATGFGPWGMDRACGRHALLLAGALFALMIGASSPGSAQTTPSTGDVDLAADPEIDDGLAPMGGIDREAGLEAEAEFEEEQESGSIHNPDPWESMNRKIFWFNEMADIYFVLPIAKGWRFTTPQVIRNAVENFNELLVMPVIFANGVLQLKPKNSIQDLGRILYNATFGLAGFIDVATMVGIPQNDEDFGQTLGFWGAPPGPYFVIPLFGPANVRDGIGRVGDTAATYYTSLLPIYVTFIVRGVELVNLRARYIEEVDENRRESFDYYVFLRDAYLQNREVRVGRARDRFRSAAEPEDDLYYFEEDEDEDVEGQGEGEGSGDGHDEGTDDGGDDGQAER